MAQAARKKTPAHKSRGGTLVGVFIGLVLGVALCTGVMWYINGSSLPLQVRDAEPPPPAAGAEPQPLPGKPGDKPQKPRAEIAENAQMTQPAAETHLQTDPAASIEATVPQPAVAPDAPSEALLTLQVGAYSSEDEADNVRARLALLGMEASVQMHPVAGKGTLFRVRLGPFASVEDMRRVRADLAQNGIEASVVR